MCDCACNIWQVRPLASGVGDSDDGVALVDDEGRGGLAVEGEELAEDVDQQRHEGAVSDDPIDDHRGGGVEGHV